MSAVFGVIGSIIAVIGTAVAGSVTAVVFVILLKSGTIGDMWSLAMAFVTGAWNALGSFFSFLGELVRAF